MNEETIAEESGKPKRKPMSKKLRFEVFKRDAFKCQYCGRCAPDVVLHVDHIDPVSNGGENDLLNLITSCVDCNSGKSDRLLSDNSAMAKQRAQLEELNERREQLEQMLQWREGLRGISDMSVDAACDAWSQIAPGTSVNELGRKEFAKLIDKFGLNELLNAIEAAARYLRKEGDEFTQDSLGTAWQKIGGICRTNSQPEWKKELYYIRGILRNRLSYINQPVCLALLESAYEAGVPIEELKDLSLAARSWTQFRNTIESMFEGDE